MMSTYGYQKHDASDAGQFTVTVTTPDGVTGGVLFTRTEGAAAAIAGILQSDQDTRDVTKTGVPPGRELTRRHQAGLEQEFPGTPRPSHPGITVAQPEDPDSALAAHSLIWRVSTALAIAGIPADEIRLFEDSVADFTSYKNVLNVARYWLTITP
jgi:hypothetical protein